MNVTDLMQSFFGGDNAAKLGQVVGLDAASAQKALGTGLPMQLDALADHAGTAQGQSQIMEAIQNLPKFGSVGEALSGADGAVNLQRAGELLGPALLGGKADSIVSAVAAQVGGGSAGGVQKMMQMALPLMLSQLGQHGGLNAGNIGGLLGGLKGGMGGLGGLLGAGAAGLGGAAAMGMGAVGNLGNAAKGAVTGLGGAAADAAAGLGDTAKGAVAGLGNAAAGLGGTAAGAAAGLGNTAKGAMAGLGGAASGALGLGAAALGAAGMGGALTSGGLMDLLKGQFSGALADKLGSVAGFGGSTAGRATQAALPVVLNALVNKGKTEAGASDILNMARSFTGLSDASGHLNAAVLNDPAQVATIEGQGRGLLGSLFGNVDEITGRLGTALGGSGSSAGKLLALMTPMVLSVLGGRGLNAGALSGLLGGLGGNLTSMLPAGLGGLGALLGTGAAAAAVTAPSVKTPNVAASVPPRPTTPAAVPPVVTNTVNTAQRRGGFPLWLIPLLLLLGLGGCWLLNQNKGTTTASTDTTTTGTTTGTDTTTTGAATGTTAAADGTFAITDPAAGAKLPAGGFNLSGTGKPGDEVEIFEDGTSLGKAKIGEDGKWTLAVPSPAAGDHAYSVKGPDGAELGMLNATIAAPDANASAANCDKDYTLSISDGQTVNEPFRFGGVGKGKGYSVTVKRGDRTIGVKDIPLDATCGWAYQSKPGAGQVTYEVRPMGDAAAAALSTVNLTVNKQ